MRWWWLKKGVWPSILVAGFLGEPYDSQRGPFIVVSRQSRSDRAILSGLVGMNDFFIYLNLCLRDRLDIKLM